MPTATITKSIKPTSDKMNLEPAIATAFNYPGKWVHLSQFDGDRRGTKDAQRGLKRKKSLQGHKFDAIIENGRLFLRVYA